MSDTVFTYGSLMCAEIMSAVCGYQLVGEPATVDGFRRLSVKGEVYPGLIPRQESEVSGILYRGISGAALARLDAFEGAYYRRQSVSVFTSPEGALQAYCYVFRPQFYHLLSDEPWDFETFMKTGKARFESLFGARYRATEG